MSGITTHVLDVSIGKPAAGIVVKLDRQTANGDWETIGIQATDSDGRARDLMTADVTAAVHRLTFEVGPYFKHKEVESFYQEITIDFVVKDASQHYHVPLLLSPFGYSTYRGS
jgi:5-hydroxyisourate hydrolase